MFYYLLATQISIIRETEELEELESLFGQARGAVAALVIQSQNGSKVALAYEKKESPSTGPSENKNKKELEDSKKKIKSEESERKIDLEKSEKNADPDNDEKKMDLEVSPKKRSSIVSTTSSRKFKKIPFAERLALRRAEMDKMKNLAKWENLKPLLETVKTQSYVIALIVLMVRFCFN